MFPAKLIGWFLSRLLLAYLVFMAAWLGVGGVYGAAFRAGGQWLFGSFGSDGVVIFQPERRETTDTLMLLRNRKGPAGGTLPVRNDSRLVGYVPSVFLISLVLATPISRRRRVRALVIGLVLIYAFIVLRLAVTLLHAFSEETPIALFRPGPFWHRALDVAYAILAVTPPASYVVPIFVWILVSFRRSDRDVLLGRRGRVPVDGRPTGVITPRQRPPRFRDPR